MDDRQIIELYWARSEAAISETAGKYGKYCYAVAFSILRSREDAEECVSDTYLRAWGAIPPQRPERLAAFLGKITRNLSLNRYERRNAGKRGSGQVMPALDELRDCVPAAGDPEQAIEDAALAGLLNRFLASLPSDSRKVFLRRYWYLSSVREIAEAYGYSESKVKMTLLRTRNELKSILEKEGITL